MNKIRSIISHFFVPGESNNYRAKLLHTDFLSYYLIFALILTFSFRFLTSHFTNVLGFATDISVDKLYQLTNQQREKYNLKDLYYNGELALAAQAKARDMFTKNYWSHFGPNGESPWQFILASGYKYDFAGENLAKNFLFSQGVVDAWMNSPTHRENVLKSEYTDVGFAVENGVLNGEDTTLVVQMFGKPQYVAKAQITTPNPPLIQQVEAKAPAAVPVTKKVETQNITAVENTQQKPVVNLLPLTLNFQLLFFAFLALVVVIDLLYAVRLNIFRMAGKNIAHLMFFGFIIIGLFLITRGKII